jgi:hypothetical protein
MKYALLFVAVYTALFFHRAYFRVSPAAPTLSDEWGPASPRESIRTELAREKEGTGPLSLTRGVGRRSGCRRHGF